MFFMTISVFCFTFLQILVEIQSDSEQPDIDGYDVAGTEWAILNTVNNLFSTLKLKDMDKKLKLKQHSTIHNLFTSMTLQDHANLKEIARLTKIDSLDNSTHVFITQLNEVLNEDYKSDEETDAVYINNLIEEFLENLDYLKEIYGLKNNDTNLNINKDITKCLDNKENECDNATLSNNGNVSHEEILSEYWQPSARRIFEGQTVKIDRFPFMASVHFFKKFQCVGSIIKSDLVITSASCLQLYDLLNYLMQQKRCESGVDTAWNNRFFRENPAFLSVQVGSSYYEGGGEDISILEIYFHPNYNPKKLRHNLAIMRLLRALKFGAKFPEIKKIQIDKNPWPLPTNTDGIIIVGWGAKSSRNIINSPIKNKLSYAVLDYYPLSECQEVYSKEFVTRTNFCAGFFSKGGGACNHDAGGPGISQGVLVGVISFGSPVCGAPDAPTVFTKLGFYAEWIDKILSQKVHKQYRLTTAKNIKHTIPKMFETTTYKIKPIDSSDLGERELIPIKEVDTLRMKDKAHFFEEFIATVFDSNEIKEFVDEVKAERHKMKTKLEKIVRDQLQTIRKKKDNSKTSKVTKIKSKSKRKVKSKSKPKPKEASHKYYTFLNTHIKRNATKMKYGTSSITSIARVTAAYKHINITKQNPSYDYEKKLGQALERLIDNLDSEEITEYEHSYLEMLQNERLNDKRKISQSGNNSDKRLIKGKKTSTIDELYNYLFERAKKELNNDNNHNSNETENSAKNETTIEKSSEGKETENSQEDENYSDIKENKSYYSLNYEKGESEDVNISEDDYDEEGITNENHNEEKVEGESYYTEYNSQGDNNDSSENDESTESLISEEDQSSPNNNDKKGFKKSDQNASKQSRKGDYLETSRIQKTKFKNSKSKRNETEKLLRILAQSDDFYELVAKAVQEKLH